MPRLALLPFAAVLFAPALALAQLNDLPCTHRYPGSGGGMPGGSGGPSAQVGGDKHNPIQVGVYFTRFTFDEWDGADLRSLGVREADLDVTLLDVRWVSPPKIGTAQVNWLDRTRWHLGVSIPHLDYRFEGGSTERSDRGLGDVRLGAYLPLPGVSRADSGFGLPLSATLPTGDEDDDLGFGEPTAFAGLLFWKEWGSEMETELSVRGGYDHNFADSDLSLLVGGVSVLLGWKKASLEIGIDGIFGTGSDHSGGTGDDAAEDRVDALAIVNFYPADRWAIGIGVRTPLNDDGLRDDLTPTVGVTYLSR